MRSPILNFASPQLDLKLLHLTHQGHEASSKIRRLWTNMTPEATEFLSRRRAEQDAEYEDLSALHKCLESQVSELRKTNQLIQLGSSIQKLRDIRDEEIFESRLYFMRIMGQFQAEISQGVGYWQDKSDVLNILGVERRKVNVLRAAVRNLEMQIARHKAQEAKAYAAAKPAGEEPTEEKPMNISS